MSISKDTSKWIEGIERVFLDLDGTLYLADKVFEGAIDFVNHLRSQQIPFHFISNNTSNSRQDGLEKLQRMGFEPQADEMYSALDSTYDYLEQNQIKRIALMANPALEDEARDRGFVLWQDENDWGVEDSQDQPDAVILAFDKTFSWDKLRWGMRLIKRGAKFIATHPDTYCPAPDMYDPDIACLIAAFKVAECPEPVIIGKPSENFLSSLLNKYQQDPKKCALIGDRLYTDMVLANKLGMKSILTLSGEATMTKIQRIEQKCAQLILKNRSGIHSSLRESSELQDLNLSIPKLVINSVKDLI